MGVTSLCLRISDFQNLGMAEELAPLMVNVIHRAKVLSVVLPTLSPLSRRGKEETARRTCFKTHHFYVNT